MKKTAYSKSQNYPATTDVTTPEVSAQPDDTQDPEYTAIAARAHELWILRGCPEGSPEVDWEQAEAEVKQTAPRAATLSHGA
ncbi:MAG TPA: DUF2934 domain-containing protein [Bryobacteraceae bacterium]|jgi:hypothetical protein|nr:DUF2934 domain-containing protein [Bryobacteraceae bacterium]